MSNNRGYKWDPFDTDRVRSDLGARTIKGGAYTSLGQAASFVISLVRVVVLARLLTPEDFGLIGMVIAIAGFLIVFKDAGLSMATIQREEISHEQVSFLFWINVGTGLFLGLFLAFLAPAIGWFYGQPRLVPVTLALSLTFPLNALIIQHQALLKRQMEFGKLVFIQLSSAVISLAVAIIGAFLGWSYWALVASQIALPTVNAVMVWVMAPWLPGPFIRTAGTLPMLKFGGQLAVHSFLMKLMDIFPEVVIGRFFSVTALGYYTRAKALLLSPIQQATEPFLSVSTPAMSRLTNEPDKYRQYFYTHWRLLRCLMTPVFCFGVVMHDWIIDIALGTQWEPVKPLFLIITLGTALSVGIWPARILLLTQGRAGEMLKLALIRMPLRVIAVSIGALYSVEMILKLELAAIFLTSLVDIYITGSRGFVDRYALTIGYIKYTCYIFTPVILGWMARVALERMGVDGVLLVALVGFICLVLVVASCFIMPHDRVLVAQLKEKALNFLTSNF